MPKERLGVAELWGEFIQKQERKVVPLVEGGWDGFHVTDTAEAEGWEPGEHVCSLERGILC